MKNRIRMFLTVALASAMVLNVAACGSAKQGTADQTSAEETAEEESSAAEESADVEKDEADDNEKTAQEKKDGFDDGTTDFTFDNLVIPIPTYFGELQQNEGKDLSGWNLEQEGGKALAMVLIGNSDLTEGETEDQLVLKMADSLDAEEDDIADQSNWTNAGYSCGMAQINLNFEDGGTGEAVLGYVMNTDTGKNDILLLIQRSDARYDYSDDFEKIMNGITVSEDTEESRDTGTDQSEAAEDSGEVTPELKEFLDEYEAWVDSYCAFMEKYAADPSDLTLLSEYADMMTQLGEWSEKVDAYDEKEGEMSSADLNYYIDVTTRCYNKMMKVAAGTSGS